MKRNRLSDVLGLRLTRQALRVCEERGILAHSPVSLEHQHLAKRYVVRGVESGGAVGEIGRYVTFTTEEGQPIEYLHPVEAIGVNGLHAVVVAPVLVRVEMLRTGRTYELLITQHRPGATNDGKRPPLETRLLFRGIHGRLDLDLSGKDKDARSTRVACQRPQRCRGRRPIWVLRHDSTCRTHEIGGTSDWRSKRGGR